MTRAGALYFDSFTSDTNIYTTSFDFSTERFDSPPVHAVQQWTGSNQQPDWSPDGKYLAYVSRRSGAPNDVIVIRSLDTGQTRELSPLNKVWALRWSPDSRSFAAVGYNAKWRGVLRIDAQTSDVTLLVSEQPGLLVCCAVEWSNDGKSIFYVRTTSGGSERAFVRRDLASGNEMELVRNARLGGLNLSPDRRNIVAGIGSIGTDSPSNTGLIRNAVIPTDGSPLRLLNGSTGGCAGGCSHMMFAPDGNSNLIRNNPKEGKPEVWRVFLDGAAPKKLDLDIPPRARGAFRVHPDGKRIAFVDWGAPKSEIWVVENYLRQRAGQ